MSAPSTVVQRMATAGLCAAGFLAAVAYGLADPGFGGDSMAYLTVAQNMLRNGCVSLSDPATGVCLPHWGGNQFPGYPAVIAVAAWLSLEAGSADPRAYVPGVIVLQAALLALAGYRLSRAVACLTGSFRAGLIAALIVAVSPLHFAWARWVLTETAATAAVVWVFAELLWSLHRGRLSVAPLGLALAAAFFVRYDTLPLCAAVALAAFAIHAPGQALRRGLLVAVLMALPVAGWTARNLDRGLSAMPQADYGVGYRRGDGYYTWLATWTRDFYEATHAAYPFANRDYDRIAVPARVIADPGGARARAVLARLAEHTGQAMPADFDAAFLELAGERRRDLPAQVYLVNPLYRAASLWLSPAYSFGWKLELGTAAQRLVLDDGLAGAARLLAAQPGVVAGKALLAGIRLLLTVAFLGAIALALARPGRSKGGGVSGGTGGGWGGAGVALAMVAVYCLAKTLFVVPLGQEDPRLATQPYVLMQVAVLMQAMALWRARAARGRVRA